MTYDVVVVGAGPAGSVTARFAQEKGAKVLMIDRRAEIGIPVLCGEGISQRIDKWGMLEGTNWIASTMDGAKIYAPDGTMVTLSKEMAGNETGYVVHRDLFDKELARQAGKAGVDIQLRTEALALLKDKNGKICGVKARTYDEEFEIPADIVVGADGVESRIGKWAGINTTLKPDDLETCIQYTLSNIDYHSDYAEFYLGKKIAPGGYVWIFPKEEGVFNIGIGILASLSKPGKPKQLLDAFIKSRPEFKNATCLRILAGAAPVAKPVETVKDNLVLVGDAARHVDSITGGGLTTALEGGKLAGDTISDCVKNQTFDKESLSVYETLWKQAFGQKLLRDYLVKDIMLGFDDKTLNMLADSLKDYKFDEFSTLSLVKALVLKHPTLLVKLKPLMRLSEKVK
ncbi:MAG: NAD(P)/FAD-dependent oxidoreductase [Candidatus Thermoplasmatota archaeon]|nr:NAD(P)/FAD-dependent oxidoreductase [Candidatus Thermoplasmatota archaeon]